MEKIVIVGSMFLFVLYSFKRYKIRKKNSFIDLFKQELIMEELLDKKLDLSNFDTSTIAKMETMFQGVSPEEFNNINLSDYAITEDDLK